MDLAALAALSVALLFNCAVYTYALPPCDVPSLLSAASYCFVSEVRICSRCTICVTCCGHEERNSERYQNAAKVKAKCAVRPPRTHHIILPNNVYRYDIAVRAAIELGRGKHKPLRGSVRVSHRVTEEEQHGLANDSRHLSIN